MIKRLKDIYRENKKFHQRSLALETQIFKYNQELLWAHIFKDSIRGKKPLSDLGLNVGRWAGNYSFFYVLYRVLHDFKPENILELGLGESSKFISIFLDAYSINSKHFIIEQDEDWKDIFTQNFSLKSQSEIKISPLKLETVKGHSVKVFSSLDIPENKYFDFYVIDGPNGSEHYSRFDAYKLVKNFNNNNEFIMIIDDYDRIGEQETAKLIFEELEKKERKFYTSIYSGLKDVLVIGTEKYKFIMNF